MVYLFIYCSQGEAMRAFFIKMCFSLILSKVQGGYWSNWIWFLLARNLWAVIKIHLITLDLCWPLSVLVSRSFITYLTDQLDTSNWVNPCSFVSWTACLLLSGALSFVSCYDLDLCSQGQTVRAFFIWMSFSLILSKVLGGFWLNLSIIFIDRWHMTWLLLTFSWHTFANTM